MTREVFIAGIGSTVFGVHKGTSPVALASQAAQQALVEARCAPDQIGALYLGNFVSGVLNGQEVLAGLVGDRIGLGPVPCTKVEGACASGGIAFRHAYLAVAHGLCDAAIAVGVETMTHAATPQVTSALNCALDPGDDVAAGLTFPGLFGLIWNAHAARYGTSREQVAAIVTKNKANGARNPLAQMGGQIGLDEIVQSPLIADPLRRHDCSPISDGAAAVVLTSEAFAKRAGVEPIRVLASAQCRGTPYVGGHGDLTSFGATVAAANRAYADAGISARDLSFVELHDCFSIAEIADSEDLGIVPRGQGGRWALEGRTAVGGEMPINPSGGLLAKGHPVGATGLGQVYESVLQLRGQHPNQVAGARTAATHNLGGTGVVCVVNILQRSGA